MEPHLRMFPLNYCSGLPEFVEEYENPLGFQTSTRYGAHLVFFQEHTLVVPFETASSLEGAFSYLLIFGNFFVV